MVVAAGVILTLQPGTIVKSGGPHIRVEGGSLLARGTATAPIVFTSIRDGSVGGATDTTAPPAAGDWAGLQAGDGPGGVGGGKLDLAFARVAYATSAVAATSCDCDETTVLLRQVTVDRAARHGLEAWAVAQVEVTKSTFSRTQYGVEVNARSVLITGSTISDTAGPSALAVTSQIAPPRVQNNVITGTAGGAGCLPSSFCQATVQAYGLLDLNLLTGNTGSGNAQQSFLLQGELTASGSLASLPAGWSRSSRA